MRSLLLAIPLLMACSDDATNTPPADATTEVAADSMLADSTAPDTTALDTSVPDTTVPDTTVPDTATGDTAAADATSPDAAPDVSIPETGTPLTATCSAAGGVLCTNFRWNICPKGFEPVSSTDHYACGTADGWCCRPAPASPCAASGLGNCVPSCPLDCWQPVTDTTLTCDGSKKCCRDVCK